MRVILEEVKSTVLSGGYSSAPAEYIYRLVQQADIILRIRAEEMPPDIYYVELNSALAQKFLGPDAALVEYSAALVAAFDTAAAFAVSSGVSKFQLAQIKVKLVWGVLWTGTQRGESGAFGSGA